MKSNKKKLNNIKEVLIVKNYELGGFNQKILLEGAKKNSPILLFLHGGPGSPIPFGVGCRGMYSKFTDQFISLYWDQLGCGINNCSISENMTIDHFVKMVRELLLQVRSDFPKNKLIIFGMSWGSVLAAKIAKNYPNLIDLVVTYGQVSKELFFNKETFQILENAELTKQKRRYLNSIKQRKIRNKSDIIRISRYLKKYTKGYYGTNYDKKEMQTMMTDLFNSPDYRLRDFLAIFINGYSKNKSLWEELIDVDLTTTFEGMTVPYTIIQGENDSITPTKMLFETLPPNGNSQLNIQIVSDCGHIPNMYAINKIYETLVQLKKDLHY